MFYTSASRFIHRPLFNNKCFIRQPVVLFTGHFLIINVLNASQSFYSPATLAARASKIRKFKFTLDETERLTLHCNQRQQQQQTTTVM
jgi:hypothetical protein